MRQHALRCGFVIEVCVEMQDALHAAAMLCQLQHKIQLAYACDGLHHMSHFKGAFQTILLTLPPRVPAERT